MTWRLFPAFGFVPPGSGRWRTVEALRGAPNALKRLQGPTIIAAVEPRPGETVIDFGCSSGFLAAELAFRGADVTGVDISDQPGTLGRHGAGHLRLQKIDGDGRLPFRSDQFDKALISEVLIVLKEPQERLRELHRVMKSGGVLTVVNTLGRLQLQRAYQRRGLLIRIARSLYPQTPRSYEEFCKRFLVDGDGLTRIRWYTEAELVQLVSDAGFQDIRVSKPFGGVGAPYLYTRQFLQLCRSGAVKLRFSVLRHMLLRALDGLSSRRDISTVIIQGIKR